MNGRKDSDLKKVNAAMAERISNRLSKQIRFSLGERNCSGEDKANV
jgi:hypothetical protein